jgi:hypothetical protein
MPTTTIGAVLFLVGGFIAVAWFAYQVYRKFEEN